MTTSGSGGIFWCSDEFPRLSGEAPILRPDALAFVRQEVDAHGRERLVFWMRPWGGICVFWTLDEPQDDGRKV